MEIQEKYILNDKINVYKVKNQIQLVKQSMDIVPM